MHKIIFKATLQDRLEELVSSLTYASLLRRLIRYGSMVLSLVGYALSICITLLLVYHQYHPKNWPIAPSLPPPIYTVTGWLTGFLLGCLYFLSAASDNLRDIRLFPEHTVFKRRSASNVIGWQDVTALSNAGSYIHIWFCQDTPNVIAVPKSAFSSMKGAEAFYSVMLGYWQDATGKQPPVPDTTGVWPPAPRVGNSAEPGDGSEC